MYIRTKLLWVYLIHITHITHRTALVAQLTATARDDSDVHDDTRKIREDCGR